MRLSLAAIFGLVLGLAGEAIRRKAVPGIATTYSNAMIPGVLTAAGALTLFGVVYAAYGIYDYIGPGAAFGLLGLVAFATIGLSLLHGQALAGLGLLGSMLTPALISTETPNIWALFVFLTVSWLATAAAARRQGWTVVPSRQCRAWPLGARLYRLFRNDQRRTANTCPARHAGGNNIPLARQGIRHAARPNCRNRSARATRRPRHAASATPVTRPQSHRLDGRDPAGNRLPLPMAESILIRP